MGYAWGRKKKHVASLKVKKKATGFPLMGETPIPLTFVPP